MTKLKLITWAHHILIGLAVFSAVGSFFTASLPVAIGMTILLGRLGTSTAPCYLTILENRERRRLGLPEIKGFIKHYYLGG